MSNVVVPTPSVVVVPAPTVAQPTSVKKKRRPHRRHYDDDDDDEYDDHHHWHSRHRHHSEDMGCYAWLWFIIIIVFVALFFIPLIICWTGNCASSARQDVVQMTVAGTLVHGGAGGHPTEGLRSRIGLARTMGASANNCGPGDVYNVSMQTCQPRLVYPRAMNQDLIDMGIQACDSFYQHACGEFLEAHSGTSADRSFSAAWRANQYALEHIVRDAKQGPIYAFYTACVDTLVGGKYAQETTMAIHLMMESILPPGTLDVPRLFAHLLSHGFTAPFAVFAERHPTDAQWSTVLRFSFDNFPEPHTEVAFIEDLFARGIPGTLPAYAQRKAREVSEFLKMLDAHAPVYPEELTFVEYLRSPTGLRRDMYTWVDMELASKMRFSWTPFFETLGLDLPKSYWPTWIQDLVYFQWLFGVLQQTPASTLRAYAEYSILYHTFRFMPNTAAHNSFRRMMPSEERHRIPSVRRATDVSYTETQCLHATQHLLPGQIANAYLESRGQNVVKAMVERVREMTNKLIARFVQRVSVAHWLSAEDRRRAMHKLRNIVVRIGHPTDPAWSATEAFAQTAMRPDQHVQNVNQVQSFRAAQQLHDWKTATFYNRTALDSDSGRSARDAQAKFGIPLSMVNAFYDPSTNTITVPLGILQAPFIDLRYDDISAYATMGSVIGHELAHALDPMGLYFDSHGAFHALGPWTKAGMTAYVERAKCIVDEYSIHDDLNLCQSHAGLQQRKRDLYAERVLGEAMADVVGTRLAFEAVLGDTGEMTAQRMAQAHAFFYTYAQMWCMVSTVDEQCDRLLHDVHAVSDMRVDYTLRQMPEYFAAAFHCQADTKMHGSASGSGKACNVF